MTFVKRWLPAITETPMRKTALGIAGLAVVGGAFAGPVIAMDTPTTGSPTAASVTADIKQIDKRAPSKMLDYQYKAQENFYYCAPAATRIALSAQGHTPSQDEVAKQLGTTEAGTNSAEDTTRVLNSAGGKGYQTVAIPDSTAKPEQMDRLQVDIVNAIDAKRPVVMNIKGTATDVNGVPHSYEGGHYLTVVGYDDHGRKVKIADPANPNQSEYWMSTITLANWAAERGYSA
ncbi:C39 family peptidase [Plantactinospora sp. BB1]|uniref:C39 family peptidase n=1 Tax=Plantactinospora sp. BB1 TaxID=2071627 RepID=UPI000D1780B0|nr:C39 family peptidase [Plantactinospora sp. BB1]AVT41025.1 phytochelatin synthase [Plantactinospora sp. BB1]